MTLLGNREEMLEMVDIEKGTVDRRIFSARTSTSWSWSASSPALGTSWPMTPRSPTRVISS